MKKIFFALFVLWASPAFCTTMCADDDIIAIVLDPTIRGTATSANKELFEWSVTFPYGTVWGTAACLARQEALFTVIPDLRDTNGDAVVGGERNGRFCWCKMTHPAQSQWVMRFATSSVDDCRTYCVEYCTGGVKDDARCRTNMFGSLE